MVQKNNTVTYTLKGVMDVSDITSNIQLIQKSLTNLKLPKNIGDKFEDSFKDIYSTIESIEDKLSKGFKTKSDVTGLEKDFGKLNTLYSKLIKTTRGISDNTIKNIVDPNAIKKLEQVQQKIVSIKEAINAQLNKTNTFSDITKVINTLSKETKSKSKAITNFLPALEAGDLKTVKQYVEQLKSYAANPKYFNSQNTKEGKQRQDALVAGVAKLTTLFEQLEKESGKVFDGYNADLKIAEKESKQIQKESMNAIKEQINATVSALEEQQAAASGYGDTLARTKQDQINFNNELDNLKGKITYFFGLENAIDLFKRALRNAFETVKELDAAMTETAVVTDFTVGDMWEALPKYTQTANELGATTLGAYETMTLFYQQGLNTNQVFEVGTETMKMARIASMDYVEATNLMTAALRGFNMELNEISAQKVNDVYSKLAAITAADTQEIGVAMSKTASIAASANMELETTAALLSQIIETTREAPETAGTALKTIIARFTEVKELFSQGQLTGTDEEGEEININKIDAALKNVGISLKDFLTGQKGLDDILLELASKWDSLDIATQRYIATMAAGSRQQSRFLAMMGNYDRTMELVDAAYNSTGASQKQFEKTQDSLEAKLNELSNAWNEFTMGLANNAVIKGAVDLLTLILTTINKITDAFGEGASGILKLATVIAGLRGARSVFNGLLKSAGSFLKTIKIVNRDGEIFLETINGVSKGASIFEKAKKAFNIVPSVEPSKIDIGDNNKLLRRLFDSYTGDDIPFNAEAVLSYNKAVESGIPKLQAAILLQQSEWEAKALNKKITEGLTEAELEEVVVQMNSNKALQLAQAQRLKYIKDLLFAGKATRAEAAAQLGLAKTINGTTIATSRLGAALLALPLGKILIGLGAIIALLKIVQYFSPEAKLERLQEKADKMAQAAQDSKQAFDELASSINSIKDADSKFEGLTKGTLEWKQALLETNQAVIDLINKYPELAQFIEKTESGRLDIKDEGLNQLYDKQLKKAEQAQGTSILSQLDVVREQKKQAEKEKERIELAIAQATPPSWGIQDETKKLLEQNQKDLEVNKAQAEANVSNYEIQEEALAGTLFTGIEGAFSDLASESQEYLSQLFLDSIDEEEYKHKIAKQKENITTTEGYNTKEELRALYEETLGAEADESLSKEELADAIAQARVFEDLSNSINELSSATQELNIDENLEKLFLKGSNEESAFNYTDMQAFLKPEEEGGLGLSLEKLQDSDLETIFGINETQIQNWADALGISEKKLRENFNTALEEGAYAFSLINESADLTNEELNSLTATLQEQKGVIDSGGQADLSGLTRQQLEGLDLSNLTGAERTNMITAIKNAEQQKRQAVADENSLYNERVSDKQDLNTAMSEANIGEDELNKVQSSLIALNPELKENKELLDEVSTTYLNMDTGLRKVADAWEENREALENPDDVLAYAQAIGELQGSITDLVGTKVSYKFVEENLDLIKKALDGDVESLTELQRLSTVELVGTFDLPTDEMNTLKDYALKYDGFSMEMGANLDDTGFIKTLNNMMEEGLMTSKQVQQYLNSMGYEADIETAERTMTQTIDYDMPGFLGIGKQKEKGHATITQKVPYIKSIHALGDAAPTQAARASRSRGGSSGKSGKSSGGGSSGGSTKQEDPWENTLDRLYNLLEDINEEERKRNELELEFNRITEDGNYNSNQVLKNLREQEASLKRQQRLQQMLYNERKKEMRNLLAGNKDLQKYGTYNWSDKTVEIDWDKINKVKDNDLGGRIEEYVSELERIQESMDNATDKIEEIKDEVEELKEYGKDEYKEFEERVLDAVVALRQAEIDSLSAINESINDANSELLENLTDAIDEMRQARENERTEEAIGDTQNRLAYLQRDTSNANQLEILQTQDQLDQQKQDYTDTLIDQKISELQRQNEVAVQQRQKQIDIAQKQLDRDIAYGLLWNNVYKLWQSGINSKGVILPNSQLLTTLKQAEDYQSFSKFGKIQWSKDLKKQVEKADTYSQRNGSHLNGVKSKLTTINNSIKNIKVGTTTTENSRISSGDKSDSGGNGGSQNRKTTNGGSNNYSYGSTGGNNSKNSTEVKKLQRVLNKYFGAKLSVDGIYGTKTKKAVASMQKKLYGLHYYNSKTYDGLYGSKTRKALEKYLNNKARKGSPTAAGQLFAQYFPKAIYKKGGLADFTGPAWLDGTKSKPEIVLNQQDTKNFLALKDILSKVLTNTSSSQISNSGDNYYDINIQVDSLNNDYDVDKLANRIKRIIYNDSTYRNVNTINLLR